MYRYPEGVKYRTPGYGPLIGLSGNPVTDFLAKIGVRITAPPIQLPPIRIPGTQLPPPEGPPNLFSVPSNVPTWVPVAVLGAAVMVAMAMNRRGAAKAS